MLGNRELSFDDVLAILRRRIWWIVVPAVVAPVVAFVIALKLPPEYTSQSLVLVEQQKVPDKFVTPVVTEQLNMRLVTMQEQILSRTRLQPIIERFGLYKDRVGKDPMEELVDEVRRSIKVSPIRAEGARSGGLPGFYIAFTAENPRLAQQVCTEIMSMFMEENLKLREQRAQGTTDFLSNQLDESKRKMDEQDAKMAEFKRKYIGQLPTDEQRNLQMLSTLTNQLDAVNQALVRAQQQKTLQESLLAQQTTTWHATQTTTANPVDLEKQVERLQAERLALQGRYTDSHPDIQKVDHQIELLKKKLEEVKNAPPAPPKEPRQEPTEMAQMRVALRMTQDTIRLKAAEQDRLQREIGRYQARIQSSPMVEEQFKALTRDHDKALEFYNELLQKKTQSEMATDLERRQQGEQFRVMDPPNLPERPTFPNKPLFAGGGLLAGLGLGLAMAFMLEFRDKFVRTERDVEFYLELPTLALMPNLDENSAFGTPKPSKKKLLLNRLMRRPKTRQQPVGA